MAKDIYDSLQLYLQLTLSSFCPLWLPLYFSVERRLAGGIEWQEIFYSFGFFSVLWKKPITFNVEFSAYISVSLAAEEWKTCLDLSLYTFTLCSFKGLVNPENMSFCCLCIFVSFGGGQC